MSLPLFNIALGTMESLCRSVTHPLIKNLKVGEKAGKATVAMAIMAISVVPIGTGSTSISSFVAECVKIVDKHGLKYEVTSMGTEVEGAVGDLLALAAQMHRAPFSQGADRVLTTIRLDERRDKESRIAEKKASILKRLR
jgi:uncharacterized protein (TIGR00106 family)